MKRIRNMITIALILALASMGVSAQTVRLTRARERQVRQVLDRIDSRTNTFRSSLDQALDASRMDGTRAEDNINRFVGDFDNAVRDLRDRLNRRTSTTADVQLVLDHASRIDRFMLRRQLGGRAESDWANLRVDVAELARLYGVAWNPNTQANYPPADNYPPSTNYPSYGQRRNLLTGTYRLDVSRSDDPRDAAQRAVRNLPYGNRQRVLDDLTARLESPDQLAIERRGRSVTIASSRAPQITFEADGRESVEQTSDGRTVRARATLTGDQLIVSSTGNRYNEYNVTFNPIDGGRRLSVTRRIYTNGLSQPVVAQSIYDKISDVAQFNIFDGSQPFPTTGNIPASGDFIIPDGTTLVAMLNESLTTRQARDGDRFTMTVREPGQYDGATIEGHVTGVDRGGRISGRSGMTLNFDSIRLRDGRSYRFAGLVQQVRTTNGDTVRVDTEGSVQESDSRGKTTAQRAAIGTAVGAIIGAIAGGGKGAAIGAILGAGTGAGSVYVQGRDDLELMSGTEVTIRASAPR
jgi:hypothetical protein